MRFRIQQNHTIDLLFPAALFFVFAVSALSVLLMSTRVYQSVVQRSSLNDPARTSLSYISEKLHQSDSDCLASIGSFDGCEALIIKQSYEDSSYFTYIYVYNQELKEQFVREGTSASASDGITITAVKDFTMEMPRAGLFSFSCTDERGQKTSTTVHVRSAQDSEAQNRRPS